MTVTPTKVGRFDMRPRQNQAFQYVGDNADALVEWVKSFKIGEARKANMLLGMRPTVVVRVMQYNHRVNVTVRPGEYLILSDAGIFYSMPEVIFNLTYNKG